MKSDGKWNDESCAIAGHNDGAAQGLWDGREISYTCEKLPSKTFLFSDHEKVRMVVTYHPATVTSSTMHAPKWGGENSWTITGQCNGNCEDSYSSSSTGQQRQHNFVLGVGTHDLVIKDSYGDGWHGGYLTLAYADGTQFLSTQYEGFGQNPDVPGYHYECNDDNGDDGYCHHKTISFTVEPTLTPTLVTENLKCDWESPPINIDNTGFNQHSIGALDITTNFKEVGNKDSDDSYKVWITACTGLDGGGSCAEHLVHAVFDDTAATAVFHDSIANNGQVNIGEEHKSYKVRVETNAAGVDNMYFINSVKVNAVCASI
jgi:hypothetical protein